MSESTLSLSYNDLQAEVGFYLGFGMGNASPYADVAWTTRQQQRITACITEGLRQVWDPPVLPGEGKAHDWSCLRPSATLTLTASTFVVALPDNFGSAEDKIIVTAASGAVQWWSLDLMNPARVRQDFSVTPTATGRPLRCGVEPLSPAGTTGQRFQLVVYPIADQDYTLRLQYYVLPDAMTNVNQYTFGGMQLASLIKASCIAVAEIEMDDQKGQRWDRFMERLQAAVQADRRKKEQVVGYNRDNSDNVGNFSRGDLHGWGPGMKYNGTVYP